MLLLLELMPAASALTGLALGAVLARRPRTPKPYCTCTHGYGTHDHDQGGACTAQIKRPNQWVGTGTVSSYEWVPCPCKHYDGPAPPAQTFAPYVPWPPK